MFDLEKSISEWKAGLKKSSGFEHGDIEEFESHLREQINIHVGEGDGFEEAFKKAIDQLGEIGEIGDEFHKTRKKKTPAHRQISKSVWNSSLIPGYIKVARRNILRNKVYSAINVFGLALGIGSCLLIFLYIQYHMNFDTEFKSSENIYRLTAEVQSETTGEINNAAYVPSRWGPGMAEEYPKVISSTRFFRYGAPIIIRNVERNQNFYEEGFYWADSTVFDVFGLDLSRGNVKTALSRPNTVVITEKIAKKYFQDADPIGKTLDYANGDNVRTMEVTGVMPNLPDQSHFHPEFFASITSIENAWWIVDYDRINSWRTPFWRTYILTEPNTVNEGFTAQVNSFLDGRLGEDADRFVLSFQPIQKIHLRSNLAGEFEPNGSLDLIYGLGSIAFLVLLVACINFMNLATARGMRRMREVGIRKALGSNRSQLVAQFYAESLVMTTIAFVLAILGVEAFRPILNGFTGNFISQDYLFTQWFWFGSISIILLVAVIAGSYPALYLSAFKPVQVLKGKLINLPKDILFRKGLVVGQFAISVFLLISALIISEQLNYMQKKELGFDKDYQLIVPLRGQGLQSGYASLKQKIKESPDIVRAGVSSRALMQPPNNSDLYFPDIRGNEDPVSWDYIHTDHDFPEVVDLELVEGRFFSEEFSADSNAALLNESAVKALGLDNASIIGTRVRNNWGVDGTVVGVVKDFHYSSLHNQIEPFGMLVNYQFGTRFLTLKVRGDKIDESLDYMRDLWAEFSPGTPFTYSFMDQDVENLYRAEQKESTLIIYFTILTIVISCLGLFGLVSFMTEMKTREIGIRKVLGASINQILVMISRGFLNQIILAFAIGSLVGWYLMTYWLEGFAFRIDITIGVVLIAAGILTGITMISIMGQSLKAALINPVNSLNNEN